MAVDSTPRKQLVGSLAGVTEKPAQVVLTAIERRNAPLCTEVDATTYTVLDGDEILIVDDTTAGGAVTITLPAAGAAVNRRLSIKKIGNTASVTIDGDSTETIDGATTLVLSTQYDAADIVSDGTEWWTL
jgi:hypothetical protein